MDEPPQAGSDSLAEIRSNLKLKLVEILMELHQLTSNGGDIETEANTEEARIFALNPDKGEYFAAMLKCMFVIKKHVNQLESEQAQNVRHDDYTQTRQSAIQDDSQRTPPQGQAQEFSTIAHHHGNDYSLVHHLQLPHNMDDRLDSSTPSSYDSHSLHLSQQLLSRSMQPIFASQSLLSQSSNHLHTPSSTQQNLLHTIQMQHLNLQQVLHNSSQPPPLTPLYNSQLPYFLQLHPEMLQYLHTQQVSNYQLSPHTPLTHHTLHGLQHPPPSPLHTPLHSSMPSIQTASLLQQSPRSSSPTTLQQSPFPPHQQDIHSSHIMWPHTSPRSHHYPSHHLQTTTTTSAHFVQPPPPPSHLHHGQSNSLRSNTTHANVPSHHSLQKPNTPPRRHGTQPASPPSHSQLQSGQPSPPNTHLQHGQPQPQQLQPQRASVDHNNSGLQQQVQAHLQNYYYHEQDAP